MSVVAIRNNHSVASSTLPASRNDEFNLNNNVGRKAKRDATGKPASEPSAAGGGEDITAKRQPRTFKYYTDSPLFAVGEESGIITVRNYELANAYDKPLYMLKIKIVASDGAVYYDYVKVHIHESNKAPVVNDPVKLFGIEDQEVVIGKSELLSNSYDPNGNILDISDIKVSSGEFIINEDGNIIFTPGDNFNGIVEFSYNVIDNKHSVANKALLDISAVNDAPFAIDFTPREITGDLANGYSLGVAVGSDVDIGDILSYSLVDDGAGLFAIDADSGEVTIPDVSNLDPIADNYNITIKAIDKHGAEFTKVFTLNVVKDAENNPPVIGDIEELYFSSSNYDPIFVPNSSLLKGITDHDNDQLRVVGLKVSNAELVEETDNGWFITLEQGFVGETEITYSVTDGSSTVPVLLSLNFQLLNSIPDDLEFISNTIDDDADEGTSVGFVKPTNKEVVFDSFQYLLVDNFNGAFSIDLMSGAVKVLDSSKLDFSVNPKPQFTVRIIDELGASYEETFSVNLSAADINDEGSTQQVDRPDITGNDPENNLYSLVRTEDEIAQEIYKSFQFSNAAEQIDGIPSLHIGEEYVFTGMKGGDFFYLYDVEVDDITKLYHTDGVLLEIKHNDGEEKVTKILIKGANRSRVFFNMEYDGSAVYVKFAKGI